MGCTTDNALSVPLLDNGNKKFTDRCNIKVTDGSMAKAPLPCIAFPSQQMLTDAVDLANTIDQSMQVGAVQARRCLLSSSQGKHTADKMPDFNRIV